MPQLDPRSVHREANLVMRTADPEKAEGDIEKMLDGLGGFYLSSNLTKDSGRAHLSAQIKVPADKFQEAIKQISALGFVTTKSVTAQDITQELADLRRQEIQLRNQQATLAKQATPEAQQQMAQTNAQLADLANQKKDKVATADYSTIGLEMQQQMGLAPGEKDAGWFQNEVGNALVAFAQGARVLVTVLIWLLVWSPVWVSAIFGIRWLDKFSRRGKVTAPPIA